MSALPPTPVPAPAPPAAVAAVPTLAPAPQPTPPPRVAAQVQTPYNYFGRTDGQGQRHAVFTLHSAQVGEPGHAALWLGMGDYKHSWIQGGVEQTKGDTQPYAYIEAGHNGQTIHFERFPVPYGAGVHVQLVPHVGTGHWSIIVNGHTYGTIPIQSGAQSMMELWGHGHAVGTINGRIVAGKH